MSDKQRLQIRIALSLAFGLCVTWVALYLNVGQGNSLVELPQFQTRKMMKYLEQKISDYRAQHKKYPARLEDMDLAWGGKDGWGRPFRYSRVDGKPLIESLGRDGVRGGIGLDADLSNRNPSPPQSAVPMGQILDHPFSQRMNFVALVCGVLAGTLFFNGLANQKFERKSWLALGAVFLTALCLAAFGAATIASVHVPSGH